MVAEAGTSGRWLRVRAQWRLRFAASLGQRALFVSGLPSDQRATADEHPKESGPIPIQPDPLGPRLKAHCSGATATETGTKPIRLPEQLNRLERRRHRTAEEPTCGQRHKLLHLDRSTQHAAAKLVYRRGRARHCCPARLRQSPLSTSQLCPHDRRSARLVSVVTRRWCALFLRRTSRVVQADRGLLFNFNPTATSTERQRRGLGTKQSVNKQPAQSKRVHWRRAFLVIVEVDVDIAISALPKNNRLAPGSQRCG